MIQNDKINKNDRKKRNSVDTPIAYRNDKNEKNDKNDKDEIFSTTIDILSKCRKLDILVVDDNHNDRNNLCKILIDDGHNCFQANDGYDAIDKYLIVKSLNEKFKLQFNILLSFDIIILDFIMPNMDGPQCAHKLREIGYNGFILGLVNLPMSKVIIFHFIYLSIYLFIYFFIIFFS